jgi:hypothetical protein
MIRFSIDPTSLKLCRQHDQARTRVDRQAFIPVIRNDRQQRLEPLPPLRRHNTEFGHMRPQGIDHLGPSPHQQIAGLMFASADLLLGRFDPYKTHGGTTDRLTDRLGVSGIILVAPDMSLHILRRHQTHLMAKLGQFVCP